MHIISNNMHTTVVNISGGSKPCIKVVLKPKCILVLGQLWWFFDPLQMFTTVYQLEHILESTRHILKRKRRLSHDTWKLYASIYILQCMACMHTIHATVHAYFKQLYSSIYYNAFILYTLYAVRQCMQTNIKYNACILQTLHAHYSPCLQYSRLYD